MFGTTLDVAHKQVLRPCLPDPCLELFQCRISKKVWADKRMGHVEKDEIALTVRENDNLAMLCHSGTEPVKGLFATVASISIVPGSYFLEMTTQGGRTAHVLFPPGPQSLEDIEYMLGAAAESPPIHTLKRVLVSPLGGAKCLLTLQARD